VKVLVTGSTGFLGSSLVERLLEHGYDDIVCFVRAESKSGNLNRLAAKFPKAKLTFAHGNLGSQATIESALVGVDVVYHLAAAMGGAPADMFLNTVVASKHLLEAIGKMEKKPKVVHVSSFGVYGVAELPANAMVDERTPLEPFPARRDTYSQAKLRQERLFWEYQARFGFPLVVLRPGVIYGPRGGAFSARVGLKLFGVFLHLGGENVLPLTYVDNCAEAIVVAGDSKSAVGEIYNVVDDDLVTSAEWLRGYEKGVGSVRKLPVPYAALRAVSHAVERYHQWSKGQLPAVFTPYKTATTWKGNRFDNGKLKGIGWKPIITTAEGMRRTFDYFKGLS
jgi:nucleoside-diphosphate-sugar epimerase